MKKKRICLVSDVRGWGGWVRGEYIIKHLSDEFDITIVDQNEFKEVDFNSFDLYYLLFHTMLTKKSVKRLLSENKKVITIVTVYPTIRPIFHTFPNMGPKTAFLKMANKCKAILANNQKSLDDLNSIYDNKKTFLAPRGVDPTTFYPTSNEFIQKPHSEFTVAFCGKPNPEKGLESIIKPACREAGVRLIINERNFTNALTEDQMKYFYNKADAYIVASVMDGTPNTALEAASCGKPILTNAIGNMPEFIKNGKNGFLIPLKIEEYINKLCYMKENQRKTWEMGRKARETVLKEWTWESVLNNERKIFRGVLRNEHIM